MDYQDKLLEKIIQIASFRVLMIKQILETCWTGDENEIKMTFRYIDAFLTISNTLGFEIEKEIAFPLIKDIDDFLTEPLKICLFEDELTKKIRLMYGDKYGFAFQIMQIFCLVKFTSSFLEHASGQTPPKHRQKLIQREIDCGYEFLNSIGYFFSQKAHLSLIKELFGEDINREIKKFSKLLKDETKNKDWVIKVSRNSEPFIDILFPGYDDILDRLERGEELKKRLRECGTGIKNWRNYEDICIQLLNFLFVPPFNKIFVQKRSHGNKERRDAILPNNQYLGFWNVIRDEFNSRHIICEFKNSSSNGDKTWLNQLRIYLSKPTIGQFGLLIVRNKPSKSLIQAQRDAYEQSKIMILIIDDEKMIRLIDNRIYLGIADSYLENEKIKFEINY